MGGGLLPKHRRKGFCCALAARGEWMRDSEKIPQEEEQEPLDAFCHHWETFARRYRGIGSDRLSFDLVNEPHIQDDGKMRRQDHEPWRDLIAQGVGVHCGEGGAYNRTPHDVFLAWFRDLLDILRESMIGFSLWNFRGAFGVLDSGRADVAYEDWHGHKLDRKLLALLRQF